MDKVIFIVGATASGKSAIAAEVAKKINGEIISSDSMQVYQDMDIITQAPKEEITSGIRHHLVRKISPEEEFSAAEFVIKAEDAIGDILRRGKIPVIAGGTGLYIKALTDGLFSSPPKDEALRKELEKERNEKGAEYLYKKLKNIDPDSAKVLHPNDTRRIIRAIEVYTLTGKPISEKKKEAKGICDKYHCLFFGLSLPRKTLYERINQRVESMFENGLVDEVKRLLERNLSITSRKALGIKEVESFLNGGISLEKAKEELKKNTRRYAKRQLTWFRPDKRIVWIEAARDNVRIAEDIVGYLGKERNGCPFSRA